MVDRRVNNISFDKNAPLNLENAVTRGPAETQLNEQFSELASKKRELQNKKSKATTSQEIRAINAELSEIEIKERELKGKLGVAKESDRNQLDIFRR